MKPAYSRKIGLLDTSGSSQGSEFLHILRERGATDILDVRYRSRCNSTLRSYTQAIAALGAAGVHYTCVDVASVDEAVAAARAHSVQSILPWSEPGAVLADLISDTLGLSTGNGIVLSTARRDKAQMQVVIAAAGLRSLRSQNCLSAEQALAFVCEQQLRWPVVLKPAQAAGSAGVSICQTEGDVRRCFGDLATYGHVWPGPGSAYPVSGLVVQECAHGEEFVVNIASRDGQHKVTDVWRCEKQGDLAFMRETLVQSSDDVQDVIAYTKRCLDALGFRNGASHTEVMRTSDGVVLLELNPRFQGCRAHARDAGALEVSVYEAVADALLRPEQFTPSTSYHATKAVTALFLRAQQRPLGMPRVPADVHSPLSCQLILCSRHGY